MLRLLQPCGQILVIWAAPAPESELESMRESRRAIDAWMNNLL
jgi:hypothetical protein